MFRLTIAVCMIALFTLFVPGIGQVVENPFEVMEAGEAITEMSPTGGTGTYALDRTREVVSEKGVGGPASPVMAPELGREIPPEAWMAEFGGMRPRGTPTPTPTPFVRMVRVVTGRRVLDAVSGTLLEDIQFSQLPITEVEGRFYDDGTRGGDLKADDDIYTNIEIIDKDFIGADNAELRRRFINALLAVDTAEPREFFRLLVSTDDLLSALPKNIVLEEERDDRIARVGVEKEKYLSAWIDYLNRFRKNPDDPDSDFYSVYVPIPPELPKYPYPPGYDPVAQEKAEEEARQQAVRPGYYGGPEVMMGEGMPGMPQEGSMSRYMK